VIGIVAGRLADKFHRPVVMISWDKAGLRPGIGSARSVPGFNLHAALRSATSSDRPRRPRGGGGTENRRAPARRFRGAFCEVAATQISSAEREAELLSTLRPRSAHLRCKRRSRSSGWRRSPGQFRPLLCTSGVTLQERCGPGQQRPTRRHDALAAWRDLRRWPSAAATGPTTWPPSTDPLTWPSVRSSTTSAAAGVSSCIWSIGGDNQGDNIARCRRKLLAIRLPQTVFHTFHKSHLLLSISNGNYHEPE